MPQADSIKVGNIQMLNKTFKRKRFGKFMEDTYANKNEYVVICDKSYDNRIKVFPCKVPSLDESYYQAFWVLKEDLSPPIKPISSSFQNHMKQLLKIYDKDQVKIEKEREERERNEENESFWNEAVENNGGNRDAFFDSYHDD